MHAQFGTLQYVNAQIIPKRTMIANTVITLSYELGL